MKCGKAQRDMSLRLDGELGAAEAEALEVHIAGCESCAREWRRLGRLGELLAGCETGGAPEGLSERILSGASRGGKARRTWVASMLRRAAVVVAGASIAGALCVAIVVKTTREEEARVDTGGGQVEVALSEDAQAEIARLCVEMTPGVREAVLGLGNQMSKSMTVASGLVVVEGESLSERMRMRLFEEIEAPSAEDVRDVLPGLEKEEETEDSSGTNGVSQGRRDARTEQT